MNNFEIIYLVVATVIWLAGYFHNGRFVRPKWKIPGKFIFYVGVSFALTHWFRHWGLIFILGHPIIGLIFHIKVCKENNIDWKTCEPKEKYLELQEKWAKGDFTKSTKKTMKNIPTLYEWAGDMQTFEALFETFYDKVLKDKLLKDVFENMSPEHVKHVAHFVAEVFGGEKLYTSKDGGSHAKMIGKHIGKMLTEEKRQRWMQLLLQTADELKLKNDPEFRSALVGYIEWGSRLAVINSTLTENPMDTNEPMPKWGWGETGGPYLLSKN